MGGYLSTYRRLSWPGRSGLTVALEPVAQGDPRGRGKEVILGLKAHEEALQVLDKTQLLWVRDPHSEQYVFASDHERARAARFTTIVGEAQGAQQSPRYAVPELQLP